MNNASKIFLVLIVIFQVITIINASIEIRVNSLINQGYNMQMVEAIMDLLIAASAILILCKVRGGLTALYAFAFIRVFATIPGGTDISYAYLVGKNTAVLMRDLLPFSIAMCVKTNGVSGWKAFWGRPSNKQKNESQQIADFQKKTDIITSITINEDNCSEGNKANNRIEPIRRNHNNNKAHFYWLALPVILIIVGLFYINSNKFIIKNVNDKVSYKELSEIWQYYSLFAESEELEIDETLPYLPYALSDSGAPSEALLTASKILDNILPTSLLKNKELVVVARNGDPVVLIPRDYRKKYYIFPAIRLKEINESSRKDPDKYYYVRLKDYSNGEIWNGEKLNRNEIALREENRGVHVLEISTYLPN